LAMSRQSWRSRSTLYMKAGSPPQSGHFLTRRSSVEYRIMGMVSNRGCNPGHGWLRHCTSISKVHVAPLPARPTDGSGASPAAHHGRCEWDECCMHGVSDPKWNGTRRARMMQGWWRQRALASFARLGRARAPVPTQAGQAGGTFSRAAGVSWILPGIVGCTAFGSKAGTVLDFDSSPRLQQAATSDACKSLMCRSSVR